MPATMKTVDPFIAELEQEAASTLRLLERVPGDKLTWRPHPKSMTLGQLALHIATVQGSISNFLEIDGFDVNDADFNPAAPESKAEILEKFEEAQALAATRLSALSDEQARHPWTLNKGGEQIWSMPKIALARTLMFNHLYHHRGQLTVYLRLLDVAVPVTYGRTADENPFA